MCQMLARKVRQLRTAETPKGRAGTGSRSFTKCSRKVGCNEGQLRTSHGSQHVSVWERMMERLCQSQDASSEACIVPGKYRCGQGKA